MQVVDRQTASSQVFDCTLCSRPFWPSQSCEAFLEPNKTVVFQVRRHFLPYCSIFLMPMALLAMYLSPKIGAKKHQQKPRKVAFCSVECNMHTCYNGRVKRFRTGGCHDVSKLIFASNKRAQERSGGGFAGRGSQFSVMKRKPRFFCVSKCMICLQNGGKKVPTIITTLIFYYS